MARVVTTAREFFEDDKKARAWLKRPNQALAKRTTLDYSQTSLGGEIVLELLAGLEHGVIQ